MVKIIKHGKFYKRPTITITCPECGCVFTIPAENYYKQGALWYSETVNCPECGHVCKKPSADWEPDITYEK